MTTRTPSHNGAPAELPSGLLYADVLRGAWRRKSRVLLGLLLGLSAGVLAWSYWPPTYESQVRLLVVKKKMPDARVSTVSPQLPEFVDYVSAQAALLSSPLIVHKAVQEAHLDQLNSLAAEPDPTAAILLNLKVTRDPGDLAGHALLTLTYRGRVPQDCKAVAVAIVDSYKAYLAETQVSAAADVEEVFTQWRKEVQEGIARKEGAYQTARAATPAAQWSGKDGLNFAERRFDPLENQRLAQSVRRNELQGRLAALQQAQRDGAGLEELTQMIAHWSEPGRAPIDQATETAQRITVGVHEQLLALKLQEQTLPASYGPDHPQVKALRDQVRLAEHALGARSGAEAAPAPGGTSAVSPAILVKTYLAALQKDLEISTELERSLAAQIQEEQERGRKINDLSEDLAALRVQIAGAAGLEQQIAQQLQSLSLFHEADAYLAQIISPAADGLQVVPKLFLVFPVSALLGLLLGGGLAYAAETRDQSFRTVTEIRERLGLPVIGQTEFCRIPHRVRREVGGNGRKLDSVLCTHFVPDSDASDMYRRIGLMLCLGRNGGPKSVIQITSPNRGDGRSTVSANLAVSLAQTGRRVVLVDADFRRPTLHKVFGVSSDVGVTSVLAGQAELSDALQPTSVENLSLLPCGPGSPGTAELLGRDKFAAMLNELRGRFDFVLIDTPPVLGTSDACAVAHRADAVLLALRNTQHIRPLAEQTVQMLTDQEARVMGIVVNHPAR